MHRRSKKRSSCEPGTSSRPISSSKQFTIFDHTQNPLHPHKLLPTNNANSHVITNEDLLKFSREMPHCSRISTAYGYRQKLLQSAKSRKSIQSRLTSFSKHQVNDLKHNKVNEQPDQVTEDQLHDINDQKSHLVYNSTLEGELLSSTTKRHRSKLEGEDNMAFSFEGENIVSLNVESYKKQRGQNPIPYQNSQNSFVSNWQMSSDFRPLRTGDVHSLAPIENEFI